ncbi:MAG: heavy metal-binding domain-containing protein [Elusimicrobia bacterium]|nr:heavy metal-binding domain-containing protein [Elusimicrobiota bacterium]
MKKKLLTLALLVPLFACVSALRAEETEKDMGHGRHHHSMSMESGEDAGGMEHKGHHHSMDMMDGKGRSADKADAKAEIRKVGKDEIGKISFCPVSGEKLTVTEKTVSASYKGRIYYFCCPGCDKKFVNNPEKYTARGKKQEAAHKRYVCPMGDYEGDKPGKCPKCGMNLVEKQEERKQEQAHKTYVCPMGDYEGDKPGKCPKCGMNLVEKK